jgi:hypothetical protein
MGWMVHATPRSLYTQEWPSTHYIRGWVGPGPLWTGAENLAPTGIRSPDRPLRSESLYRLSDPGPPRSAYMHVFTISSTHYSKWITLLCSVRRRALIFTADNTNNTNSHAQDTTTLHSNVFLTGIQQLMDIKANGLNFPCKTTANIKVVILSRPLCHNFTCFYLRRVHSQVGIHIYFSA